MSLHHAARTAARAALAQLLRQSRRAPLIAAEIERSLAGNSTGDDSR